MLSITLKRNEPDFTNNLSNTYIESVRFREHLGVYVSCSLKWNKQCEEVQKKENRVLTALQRKIHSGPPKVKECAYQTLVRPITGFASPAWTSHSTEGVATVESVQRQAARFVFNDDQRSTIEKYVYRRTSHGSGEAQKMSGMEGGRKSE